LTQSNIEMALHRAMSEIPWPCAMKVVSSQFQISYFSLLR